MNFYKHHIGDYDQATRHLSFVEDAAYCRLIRKYYAEEQPLPKEIKKIVRLIGARTKEEKSAVEAVLEEFFTLEDDGWHNTRCDAELETASLKAKKNREVGKLGGRPKKSETQEEPTDNPNGYLFETQTVSENNPSQTPDTRHQTPDLKAVNDDASVSDQGNGLTAAPLPTREAPPISNDPAIQLSVALRRQGVNVTFTHPAVQDWASKGATIEMLTEAVAAARLSKGPDAKIPPNYLVPIMNDLLNPPAAAPASAGKPRADDWAWRKSNGGIDAKGRELGMFARGGESYPDFAARIQQAIDKRKGQP